MVIGEDRSAQDHGQGVMIDWGLVRGVPGLDEPAHAEIKRALDDERGGETDVTAGPSGRRPSRKAAASACQSREWT